MKKQHTIRWVLYHEPIHLFVRTARAFSEELQKLTNGRIAVEVYTLEQYADKFKDGIKYDPMALIQNNDVEMSQLQINYIGLWNNPDFFALEMPYLFKDHDHATRVLDGEIGKGMLDSLQNNTHVHGLAFTYSGGYRVMASDKKITSVSEFVGTNLITTPNPVMVDTAKTLGCEPVPVMSREFNTKRELLEKPNYMIETTLPRYEYEANLQVQKHIIDTRHSMYLTSILISKTFWNSLDSEDQESVLQAAKIAAARERAESVTEADEYSENTARHQELGITYTKLDDQEMGKMREIVQPLYYKYADLFTPGLVDGIIRT